MAIYKITLSASSWTQTVAALYYNTTTPGKFYTDTAATVETTRLPIPTRETYRFDGFYSASSGGTQYIDEDGNFTDALLSLSITAAKTFYVHQTQWSYKITLNDYNGSGGQGAIYKKKTMETGDAALYVDYLCTTPVAAVTKPTRSGYAFKGYYNGTTTPGAQYIDKDGVPLSNLEAITAAKTVYAQWQAPYKVTLSSSGWSGATAAFYFDSIGGKCYTATDMTTETTSVAVPTKESQRFNGYNSASAGTGTNYIDATGAISPNIGDYVTAAKTLYAQGVIVSYKITPAQASGTGGESPFYVAANTTGDGRFHTDDQCTSSPKTRATVPARTGYTFLGYFSAASGGTKYVEPSGEFTAAFYDEAITAAKTITAQWQANTYRLTFDPTGGTTPTQYKTVTFGAAVGTLPTPTHTRGTFVRWEYNGEALTASTVWNAAQNGTAYAKWNKHFGSVVDYFNFASDALVPIESDSGDNKRRICVANADWTGSGSSLKQSGGAGKYSSGVNETGGIWRNPTVTYAVVKNTTLDVTLGKAFAKTGTTISGYMITSVAVHTAVGQFPRVTISATANEGADAINTYRVQVGIVARSKAQNLQSAISGGGYLQELTLVAEAEPVVCEENLMPCASDIVGGRIEVQATTVSPNSESAPTAGTDFTSVGEPKKTAESSYSSYQITVQKELT